MLCKYIYTVIQYSLTIHLYFTLRSTYHGWCIRYSYHAIGVSHACTVHVSISSHKLPRDYGHRHAKLSGAVVIVVAEPHVAPCARTATMLSKCAVEKGCLRCGTKASSSPHRGHLVPRAYATSVMSGKYRPQSRITRLKAYMANRLLVSIP